MRPYSLTLSCTLLYICMLSPATTTTQPTTTTLYIHPSKNITLPCNINTRDDNNLYYWSRMNMFDKDNVAIGDVILEGGYRLTTTQQNNYNLHITNVTYERDNGIYNCILKQIGTGLLLHSSTVHLVVIYPPGPPVIQALSSLTEGDRVQLVCSSVGGSPSAVVEWGKWGVGAGGSGGTGGGEGAGGAGGGTGSTARFNVVKDNVVKIIPETRFNASKAVLMIDAVRKEDDGGRYRCGVVGGGEEVDYAEITLNVNYSPRLTTLQQTIRLIIGQSTTLTCNIDSKPLPTSIQWTKDTKLLSTTNSVNLQRVSLEHAGSYICTVDNIVGIATVDVNVDVLFAPVVKLIDKIVLDLGEDLVVKCDVKANPRVVRFRWWRVNAPMSGGGGGVSMSGGSGGAPTSGSLPAMSVGDAGGDDFVEVGDGEVLRLVNVEATDAGNYYCGATNVLNPSNGEPIESTSNATVQVFIRHAPGIAKILPLEPHIVEGGSVVLECVLEVAEGWPDVEYRWWHSSNPTNTISTKRTLQIHQKNPTDGTYNCQASNELGTSTTASTTLILHQPPKLIQNLPTQLTRKIGDEFSISCSAVGRPKPSVVWSKDGAVVGGGGDGFYKVVSEDGVGGVMVKSMLMFSGGERRGDGVRVDDRGYYTCAWENGVGDGGGAGVRGDLYLRVQHPPIHYNNPPQTTEQLTAYDQTETAYLTCTFISYPTPTFKWTHNNNQIYTFNTTPLTNEVYKSILQIKQVEEHDYGDYKCIVSNALGESIFNVRLVKKGRPAMATGLKVLEAGAEWMLLDFMPGFDGGLNVEYVLSYYSEVGEEGEFKCGDMRPCNLTGLASGGIYVVKVISINARGTSPPSTSITNTTHLTTLPQPTNAIYEPTTRTVLFTLPQQQQQQQRHLQLVAKIYLTINKQQQILTIPINGDKFKYRLEDGVDKLELLLCVFDICSRKVEPNFVSIDELVAMETANVVIGKEYLIGVIVISVLLGILVVLCVVWRCCRRRGDVVVGGGEGKEAVTNDGVGGGGGEMAPPPPYSKAYEEYYYRAEEGEEEEDYSGGDEEEMSSPWQQRGGGADDGNLFMFLGDPHQQQQFLYEPAQAMQDNSHYERDSQATPPIRPRVIREIIV